MIPHASMPAREGLFSLNRMNYKGTAQQIAMCWGIGLQGSYSGRPTELGTLQESEEDPERPLPGFTKGISVSCFLKLQPFSFYDYLKIKHSF